MTLLHFTRLAVAAALAASAAGAQDTLPGWTKHRAITLNTSASGANVANNVLGFPVLIRLTAAESTIFSGARAGGADLRFTKPSGGQLPYQIESWDGTAKSAAIWVRVDTVKGNNSTQAINLHWGNDTATTRSSGPSVFDTTAAAGYKAVLHMNEATGNVNDATASAVVGTNTGTTTTPGAIGAGRRFGGTNAANTASEDGRQMITLGAPAALNFSGPMTYSTWARWLNVGPTEGSSHYRTALWRASDGGGEVFVRIGTTGEPDNYYAGRWTGSASLTTSTTATASASSDSATWIHLAGVYDGAKWKLYRNGQLAGESPEDLQGQQSPATAWHLGRSGIGSSLSDRWWSGDLDEVRISRVARSADYLKLTYESQKASQKFTSIGVMITAPRPPTGVGAVPALKTDSSVTVTWLAPEDNGGAAITGYRAYAIADSSKSCTTTALTCKIAHLPAGQQVFVVRAINSAGTSLPSAPSDPVSTPVGISAPGNHSVVFRVTGGPLPYSFRIPETFAASTQRLALEVFDSYGRKVWASSVEPSRTGDLSVQWNGRNANGVKAATGMYLAQIKVEAGDRSIRMNVKGLKK